MQIPAFMSFWYDVVPLSVATLVVAIVIIVDRVRRKT